MWTSIFVLGLFLRSSEARFLRIGGDAPVFKSLVIRAPQMGVSFNGLPSGSGTGLVSTPTSSSTTSSSVYSDDVSSDSMLPGYSTASAISFSSTVSMLSDSSRTDIYTSNLQSLSSPTSQSEFQPQSFSSSSFSSSSFSRQFATTDSTTAPTAPLPSPTLTPSTSQLHFDSPIVVTTVINSQTNVLIVPSGTDQGPPITVTETATLDPETPEATSSAAAVASAISSSHDILNQYFSNVMDHGQGQAADDSFESTATILGVLYAKLSKSSKSGGGGGGGGGCKKTLFSLVGCALSTVKKASSAVKAGVKAGLDVATNQEKITRIIEDEAVRAGLDVGSKGIDAIAAAVAEAAQSLKDGPEDEPTPSESPQSTSEPTESRDSSISSTTTPSSTSSSFASSSSSSSSSSGSSSSSSSSSSFHDFCDVLDTSMPPCPTFTGINKNTNNEPSVLFELTSLTWMTGGPTPMSTVSLDLSAPSASSMISTFSVASSPTYSASSSYVSSATPESPSSSRSSNDVQGSGTLSSASFPQSSSSSSFASSSAFSQPNTPSTSTPALPSSTLAVQNSPTSILNPITSPPSTFNTVTIAPSAASSSLSMHCETYIVDQNQCICTAADGSVFVDDRDKC
ncbi:uncharacterized protein BDZ99DRAFT_569977 [Mytilinidion resinicola]|uniref:Extracellular membrane protein CFEM domain-containing protein n=1 Tax=Mytilinidion resinicola TaxID=574789 RepID=A0A6A6YQ15_9PEZI|nr:uncharacterized protein BDZ99DRAFT_569977 [Mytilinidion resinicola]KAF2810628.1 hypothetical protein BDZ99DRAFT_569977 [Mytilinidion resinicola]